MNAKTNTASALFADVAEYCRLGDAQDLKVESIKAMCKGITSKKELRSFLLPAVAAHYKVEVKKGERGVTFATTHETAKSRLNRLVQAIIGKSAKAEVEIDFADDIVNAMLKVQKMLKDYADYEVDGKKVGEAKAMALLIAEAKDRIAI